MYTFVVACSYLLSTDSAAELEEYLGEILDITVPDNNKFVQELLQQWQQRNQISNEPPVHSSKVWFLSNSFNR